MTTRARRPTDETGTEVDAPASWSHDAPASWDHDATEVNPQQARAAAEVEEATPTHIEALRSEPIRVISMKDRSAAAPRPDAVRIPLHVQLRSMAEVAGRNEPATGLGHLAPPRDARQARRRRQRDNVVWACVAIALACAISLGIWLIAG